MKIIFLIIVTAGFALGQGVKPNIILLMADDLGYGDTGFNGNQVIQTLSFDPLAASGVKLTRFYAGNSVCSPTRGTCLTGRHHDRYGIWFANEGHLPKKEITLARRLWKQGYTVGHFGKWHRGTEQYQNIQGKGPQTHAELCTTLGARLRHKFRHRSNLQVTCSELYPG